MPSLDQALFQIAIIEEKLLERKLETVLFLLCKREKRMLESTEYVGTVATCSPKTGWGAGGRDKLADLLTRISELLEQ